MNTIDKAMTWVENNTNFFISTVCGIIWATVIYSIYLAINKQ